MEVLKKRDQSLDLISGILIIHMIYYHICIFTNTNYDLGNILFFFMPWFFFKSGMFFCYNPETQCEIKKNAKKLLIPFFWFSLIGLFFFYIELIISNDYNWLHYISFPYSLLLSGSISANSPLWFLSTLFIVKVSYNLLNNLLPIHIILSISVGIALLCFFLGLSRPFYLANSAVGLFFYSLGHKFKDLQYQKIVVIISIIVFSLIACCNFSVVDMFQNKLTHGNYLLWFPFALSGIVVINNLGKLFPPHNSLILYRLLISVGNNSINFYVIHWIILIICKTLMLKLFHFDINNYEYLFSQILFCITALPIINYYLRNKAYLKFLIGK